MTNTLVEVTNQLLAAPLVEADWQAFAAGVSLTAVAFTIGAVFRLVRRSFGGWETD